jgi:hypothetical protein
VSYIQTKDSNDDLVSIVESRESLFNVEWLYWEASNFKAQTREAAKESKQMFNLILKGLGFKKVNESLSPLVKFFSKSSNKQVRRLSRRQNPIRVLSKRFPTLIRGLENVLLVLKKKKYKYLFRDFDMILKLVDFNSQCFNAKDADEIVYTLIHCGFLKWSPKEMTVDRGYSITYVFYFIRRNRLWLGIQPDNNFSEKLLRLTELNCCILSVTLRRMLQGEDDKVEDIKKILKDVGFKFYSMQ